MVSEAEMTFRLRGIPYDYAVRDVVQLVKEQLSLEDDTQVTVRSLARHPFFNSQDATLSFSRIPALLMENDEYFTGLQSDRKGSAIPARRLQFDTHFQGLTPLHSTKDEDCELDIVAISGLNGHAFGSFKQKKHAYMWLRDDLPMDLPSTRIFTYGYNTRGRSVQNIYDLGTALRITLNTLQESSVTPDPKPMIIIAHSLGGLIVKDAVIQMAESSDPIGQATFKALKGILFFGVPSQGMNIESLVPILDEPLRRTLLYTLDDRNSPTLRHLGEMFPKIIRRLWESGEFECVNFYETQESPTAIQTEGVWAMNGPLELLVKPASATQGKLYDDLREAHRVVSVDRTHSDLVKFNGPFDDVYQMVLTTLRAMKDRTRPQPLVNQMTKNHTSDQLLALTKNHGNECLKSLAFLEQFSREYEDDINPADGTCEWIVDHPVFLYWNGKDDTDVADGTRGQAVTHQSDPSCKDKSRETLWVLGNPGAGKSTSMKHAVRHMRRTMNASERKILAAFFVHGRGRELQKSRLGVYRSILHQILPRFPEQLSDLTREYQKRVELRGRRGKKWTWSEQELRESLQKVLKSASQERRVMIFIDALDEMGEDRANKLAQDFQQMAAEAPSSVRLCFSCRYYLIIVENANLTIGVEKENHRDIENFVKGHSTMKKLGELDRDLLGNIIIEKANGIFQWVALVLDQVTRLHRKRKPAQHIIGKIQQVPEKLEGLYRILLQGSEPDDRPQTVKLFQWILFSFRPLTLPEIREALIVDAKTTCNSVLRCRTSEHFVLKDEDLKVVITDLSKGLVEVVTDSCLAEKGGIAGPYAQFIHQTVPDYLLQGGLEELDAFTGKSSSGRGHFQLSRSCINYLRFQEMQAFPIMFRDWIRQRKGRPWNTRTWLKTPQEEHRQAFQLAFPLASYANRYWIFHMIKVENNEISQTDLLDLFVWWEEDDRLPLSFLPPDKNHLEGTVFSSGYFPQWFNELSDTDSKTRNAAIFWKNRESTSTKLLTPFMAWQLGNHTKQKHLVHVLSLAGIWSALVEMGIRNKKIYDFTDFEGYTPLNMALVGRHEDIIKQCVRFLRPEMFGVKYHQALVSALFAAAALRLGDVVETLSTMMPEYYRTLTLHAAVSAKDFKAVMLLAQKRTESDILFTILKNDKRDFPDDHKAEGYHDQFILPTTGQFGWDIIGEVYKEPRSHNQIEDLPT